MIIQGIILYFVILTLVAALSRETRIVEKEVVVDRYLPAKEVVVDRYLPAKSTVSEARPHPYKEPVVGLKWFRTKDFPPPHDVVLAAFDTSDCGWVVVSAWYDPKKETWVAAGPDEHTPLRFKYTHWAFQPAPPPLSEAKYSDYEPPNRY